MLKTSLISVVIFTLILVAGCPAPPPVAPAVEPPAVESPAVVEDEIQLTVVTYFIPDSPSGRAFDHILTKFQEARPNIQVEHVYVPFAELIPTHTRQAMVGELPDIVFADNPDVQYLAEADVFLDLTSLVEEWGQWDDFVVGSRYATTWQENVYTIHFGTNNLALFYNKDYFERAGIASPPTTWQELLEVSQILTDELRPEGVYAIGFSAIDSEEGTWQFLPFLWSNGGSLLELHEPAAIEALELWTTLVQQGYAPADVLTWGQTPGVLPEFSAGRLAMMINGPWILPALREAEVDYDIAPLPVPMEGQMPVVGMGGETLGLASTIDPAKLDAGWELIKFFADNMVEFTILGGRVPTRHSMIPLVEQEDPELVVFSLQAAGALPRPIMGGDEKYTQVSAVTRLYMQRALIGELTPEEAFTQASREIRDLFATEEEYQEAVAQARTVLAEVLGAP